jgi:hypothetical protein
MQERIKYIGCKLLDVFSPPYEPLHAKVLRVLPIEQQPISKMINEGYGTDSSEEDIVIESSIEYSEQQCSYIRLVINFLYNYPTLTNLIVNIFIIACFAAFFAAGMVPKSKLNNIISLTII